MKNNKNHSVTDLLYKAMMLLENEEECFDFLKDLCTVPELKALSQRIEVANMLYQGKAYKDIVDVTGASTATISRVKNALDYSDYHGYKRVFERLYDK